jgi:hypothetical protein
MDSLQRINTAAKIITLGDLNDGPLIIVSKKSFRELLQIKCPAGNLSFEEMAKKGLGTIAFRDSWDIFDQIMVSQTLINK